MTSNIMCRAVKKAISISADGGLTPCCVMPKNNEFQFIDAESIKQYKDSSWVNNLFTNMEKGIQPKECSVCYTNEQLGLKSYRNYINSTLAPDPEAYEFLDLYLGNLCNSECAMCGPDFSSKIEARISKTQQSNIFPKGLIKEVSINKQNTKWFNQPGFFDWFKQQAPTLKLLKFWGGEPFLIENIKEWINWLIEQGYSKNITLHFNTNASVLNQELLFACIKNFKYVVVHASVDGTADTFNYIRHGLEWPVVKEHILKFRDYSIAFKNKFHVTVLCVVQIYNLKNLTELLKWIDDNNLSLSWIFIETPSYLKISTLTDKTQIQNTIDDLKKLNLATQEKNISALIEYLNLSIETPSSNYQNFISYTNYLNSFRTLQFNTETLEVN